ncbi:MAG: tetratricopeptide repeat protein [Deltaproteobacteria bacterium]|nr:tetratricopeptide repeat protein [Deltaproteobacteria bacterium]
MSQNIARAKSLIQRHELTRALDCLLSALDGFDPNNLIGKARFEVEVNIRQCVSEINLNPRIRDLLTDLTHSSKAIIPYTPGAEAALRTVLTALRNALEHIEQAEKQGAQQALRQRKADLLATGENFLAQGEGVKAKIELRKLAEEYGKEPGVYSQIGLMFVKAHLAHDAAEFLELAIEAYPKDSQCYGPLVECYMSAQEYEKAEAVYLKVLKNLGSHPRTLVNLAKVYKLQNKRQKAAETAQRALSMDPNNEEAKEMVEGIR